MKDISVTNGGLSRYCHCRVSSIANNSPLFAFTYRFTAEVKIYSGHFYTLKVISVDVNLIMPLSATAPVDYGK